MKQDIKIKKLLAMVMAVTLMFSAISMTSVVSATDSGGCTHVCGDGACAYDEGADCTHTCSEDCAQGCIHIEHDKDCGWREAAPCGHAHDENCGGLPGVPENRTADNEPGPPAGTVVAEFEAPQPKETVKVGTAEGGDPAVITAFAPLDDAVANQKYPPRTPVSDITPNLPEALEATVDGETASVPVEWDTSAYDPIGEGPFEFLPILGEGYALDPADPPLPVITVLRGGENGLLRTSGEVVLSEEKTVEENEAAIQAALTTAFSGDVVTVTGSKTNMDSNFLLGMNNGATLRWRATITAAENISLGGSGLLSLQGSGRFEMTGGAIKAAANGAIFAENVTAAISGGVVENSAIRSDLPAITARDVTVSGSGEVRALEGNGTAISARNVTVSGSGKVQALGVKGIAINASGNVRVTSGEVSARTTAIKLLSKNTTASITGGVVSAQYDDPNTTAEAIAVNHEGCTVSIGGEAVVHSAWNVIGSSYPTKVEMSGGEIHGQINIGSGGSSLKMTSGTYTSDRWGIMCNGNVEIRGGEIHIHSDSISCSGTLLVTDGEIISTNGDAIENSTSGAKADIRGGYIRGHHSAVSQSIVSISGGTVTCDRTGANTLIEGDEVTISGTTKITLPDNAKGIEAVNKVVVTSGEIYANTATAITTTGEDATVTVSGGKICATTGTAIIATGQNATVTVSGGLVFAYGTSQYGGYYTGLRNVVYMENNRPGFQRTGNGVVIGWRTYDPVTSYSAGSDRYIYPLDSDDAPRGFTAYWAVDGDDSGIYYANGANTGFIPLPVTVTRATLTQSDFTYTDPATLSRAYDGQATPVTASCKESGFNDTTGGAISVTYTGTGETVYPESATPPKNAGSYTVTLKTAGGTNYEPCDLALGSFTITKAPLSITKAAIASKTYDGTTDATVNSVTFDGLQASETLTPGTDYTATGTFTDANAGTQTVDMTVKLLGTDKAANYTLSDGSYQTTANITKATYSGSAPNLDYSVYTEGAQSYTIPLAGLLPTVAGTLGTVSYAYSSVASDPAGIVNGTPTVDKGNLLVDVNNIVAGATDTATVGIRIESQNYKDIAATVNLKLTDKADVSAKISFADGNATYTGSTLTHETATISITPVGIPTWTYTYAAVDGGAILDGGKPLTAGSYTVTAAYEDDGNKGSATVNFTVNKATPAGTPVCTAITQSGKTLADAKLTGSFVNTYDGNSVVPGTLIWDDGAATTVTADTAYGWTFTPDDTANYNIRTGSLTPYQSSGGSGGGSGSGTTAVITGLPNDYTLLMGQSVSWTPAPAGGAWSYHKDLLAMTQDGDTYTFTALKTGKATATYTVDGVPHTVHITINASAILQTGDTANPLPWLMLMLTVLVGCVSLLYRKRSAKD